MPDYTDSPAYDRAIALGWTSDSRIHPAMFVSHARLDALRAAYAAGSQFAKFEGKLYELSHGHPTLGGRMHSVSYRPADWTGPGWLSCFTARART